MPVVTVGEITITEVSDGFDGPALQIISSAAGFTYQDGVASPADQTISFTLLRQGLDNTEANWAASGATLETNKGRVDVTEYIFGLPGTGDGDTAYLTLAQFGTARQMSIGATVGSLAAYANVSRIGDSTAQAGATRNILSGDWVTATAYGVGDIVVSSGFRWICILAHISSGSVMPPVFPATSNLYWRLEAARGALTTSRAIAGSTWVDADAATAIADAGGVSPIQGDVVTLFNTTAGYSETRIRSSAGPWTALSVIFGGNVIVDNTLTASKIQASAVTTEKLAANAVTAAKIAANTVTAAQIAANTITAAQIAANTITASQIAANTVTAAQIAAGTIGATQIAANAITASKIAVVDMTNIWRNPDFAGGSSDGLFLGTSGAIVLATDAGVPASAPTAHVFKRAVPPATVTDLGHNNWIAAAPGETFYFEITAAAEAGTNGSIQLQMRYADATLATNLGVVAGSALSAASYTTWTRFGATVTVPASVSGLPVAYVRFYVRSNINASPAGAWYVTRVIVRRAANSEMVVDGAITASKIEAAAVTADKIQAGAVTASKLAVVDTFNLVKNPSFDGGSFDGWSGTGGQVLAKTAGGVPAGAPAEYVRSASVVAGYNNDQYFLGYCDVRPGDTFYCEWYGASTADANAQCRLFVAISDQALTATTWPNVAVASTANTSWTRYSGSYTVPATFSGSNVPARMRIGIGPAANASPAGTWYFTKVTVRRSANAELVVDGAITASKIQGGAVTTDKLLVTGQGSALNDDPTTSDISAWTLYSGNQPTIATITEAAAGRTALRGTNSTWVNSRTFAVDVNKKYRLRCWARRDTDPTNPASGTFYLRAEWFNSSGTSLSYTDAPVVALTSSWLRRDTGEMTPPANAVSARVMVIFNYGGSTGYHEAQDVRFEEVIGADLIVDGSIVAAKLAASTITGNKIAADTITAGNIATGAVTAAEIAAGAIRANHILVAPKSLNLDPSFEGGTAIWTGFVQRLARSNAAVPASCPVPFAAQFSSRDNLSGASIEVVPGEVYRASCYVNRGTGSGGGGIGIYGGVRAADGSTVATFSWPGTTTTATGWVRVTGLYTIPANGATLVFGPWADRPTYTGEAWYADLNIEKVNDASLIVDGAITAVKIDAGAVTTAKLAAAAVTADTIASNAITAAKIEAGAVITAKIAAGAVTANEIAAVTITGAKIAAGTITATQIAADTITSGQIAAGAVTASEIAAGAITADKVLITGRGSALNDDPSTSDISAWTLNSGTQPTIETVTGAAVGRTAIRGTNSTWVNSKTFAVDISKKYRLRCWARRDTSATPATGTFYLRAEWFNSAGTSLSYTDVASTALTSAWLKRDTGEMTPPANAVSARIMLILNYSGTTGYHEAQDVRFEEVIGADLIVDGSIVAGKLSANAVTAVKIDAGAVTTAKLAAGAVTANEIGAGAITTAKLAAGAVTANEIAANAVTTVKLAALAVTAAKISAGAITTDKLLVTGRGAALNDDPVVSDISAWTLNSGTAPTIQAVTDGTMGTTTLRASNSTWVNSRTFAVDVNRKYRLRCWARRDTDPTNPASGSFWLRVEWFNGSGASISFTTASPANALTSAWVRRDTGEMTPPTGAVSARVMLIFNYNGTTGYHEAQDVRFEEVIGADLIVDGSIIAGKLAANSIAVGTAAIENGAIVNAMLGAAAITTAKIADAAITTAKIGDAQITNAKINDLNASKITAGTISADRIGANTITASKINGADLQISASGVELGNDVGPGTGHYGLSLASDNFNNIFLRRNDGVVFFRINDGGTQSLTFDSSSGNLSIRGAINGGAYTGYAWPASGTGFHVGPNGILLGNYNVVLGNGKRSYFQIEASGNVYSSGFNVVDGVLSASIINTDQLVGGAAAESASATSTGSSVSVTVSVPANASAMLIQYFLGPGTFTAGSSNSKYGGGSADVYGPVLTGLTDNGNTTGAIIVSPSAGNHTITVSRDLYTGTMRLGVVVLKR